MKRRKRKKVTAMGLAVVMAATVPMQVFATEGVEENTQVNEQVNEQADVTGSAVGEQTEGFSFQFDATTGIAAVTGYTGVDTAIVIPAQTVKGGITYKVTSVAERAFYNNDSIISVIFEGGIKNIGNSAFEHCDSLQKVELCDSIESMGEGVFSGCSQLKEVRLSAGLKQISNQAFFDCKNLKEIQIPDAVELINSWSFDNCTSLEKVVFSSSSMCKTIGNSAFEGCTTLKNVTLSPLTESIHARAFYGCSNISSIVIPRRVSYIGTETFKNCTSLSELQFETPSALKKIGSQAFYNCNFSKVELPEGLEEIAENDMYYGCDCGKVFFENPIQKLVLPRTLKQMGWNDSIVSNDDQKVVVIKSNIWIQSFGKNTEIYGLLNSRVQQGAQEYGYSFFPIDAPSGLKVKDMNNNTVKLSWNAVTAVSKYKILRSSAENGVYQEIGQVQGTEYIDKTVGNTKHYYKICLTYTDCLGETVDGLESNVGYVKDLKEAVIDKIPDADYTGGAVTPGVTVRYKGKVLKNGQDYTVSYKNNVNFGTAKVTVTALSSSEYCGMKETGFLIKVKTPTVTNVENTASGINIKWGKVTGAEQYYIYRKAENGKWSKIATVGSSKDSYCDTSVHSGTRYSYSVAAYANGWTSPYDASGKTLRYLAQPALNSVENVSSGATIKWKKVKGAAGYRIYRKKGSSAWQYVAAVSGENTKTYTDKKVKSKNGETYFYTVCAYNGNDKGTYHRTGKKIIRLTAPALNNPVNKAAKKLEVKWKKNNKAAGYQVQYSTSKKFSGAKTLNIKSKNTTKKTISKLKKNKKYYIRIRSYKKSGKTTYYSNWSSKKSKKITK